MNPNPVRQPPPARAEAPPGSGAPARTRAGADRWLGVLSLAGCLCLPFLPTPALAGEILVSAAASLTGAFGEVGPAFASSSPGERVLFNFGASGALLRQLEAGAAADLLATADRATMDQAEARGLLVAGSRRVFARNRIVLIAPAGTATPASLAGLAAAEVRRIAVGKPESTPFGRYAAQALAHAGLSERLAPKLIPCETVRQALDYVRRGEVDAAIVFATDAALSSDRVRVVATLAGHDPVEYHLALLRGSRASAAAGAFAAFLAGPRGSEVLTRFGFLPPQP